MVRQIDDVKVDIYQHGEGEAYFAGRSCAPAGATV